MPVRRFAGAPVRRRANKSALGSVIVAQTPAAFRLSQNTGSPAYRLTGAPFSDSDEYVAAFDFHVEAPHFRVRIVW
jgi:hypothetical protein